MPRMMSNQKETQPDHPEGRVSSLPDPVRVNLPIDATGPFQVKHVVDGDTFELHPEVTLKYLEVGKPKSGMPKARMIRVLGVDAPELKKGAKKGASFSEEARDFTQKLIGGKDVWLCYGYQKTDKYHRELAIVYVADDRVDSHGSYLCLNLELIFAGFAYFYSPKPIPKDAHRTLIAAQYEARKADRHLWHHYTDFDAVVIAKRKCLHIPQCPSISNLLHVTEIKASEGFDKGLSMCRKCLNNGVRSAPPRPPTPSDTSTSSSEGEQ
eukprot:GILI01013593.1.p1 GENE.GILI01013593.1~~GILI01013593.1.p1  ORF type:complete len:267 (+),score=19.94 GILI01013593.1:44-844(+)